MKKPAKIPRLTGNSRYFSPARNRLKKKTRRTIVSTLGHQLAKGGLEDFSVLRLAQNAGVSKRTIYRYFESRQVLLDALGKWVKQTLVGSESKNGSVEIQSSEQLFGHLSKRFQAFDRNPTLAKAGIFTKAGREARKLTFKEHTLTRFNKIFANDVKDLGEEDARRVKAIISLLFTLEAWEFFRENWGMSGTQAANNAAWAAKVLLSHFRDE